MRLPGSLNGKKELIVIVGFVAMGQEPHAVYITQEGGLSSAPISKVKVSPVAVAQSEDVREYRLR